MGSDEDLYYDNEDGGDGDSRRQKNYTILTEDKIRQLQNNDISEVCSLLSVSRGLACTLLRRYNWSPISVSEEWFANEEKVRDAVGLLLLPGQQESSRSDKYLCKICLKKVKGKRMLWGPCGRHPFCLKCWKNYASASIDDGPACLSMLCPEPKCKANVGPELIDLLASEEDKDKYYHYLLRSYVEGNRYIKWCPGLGCDRAVQIESGERENYDVTCDSCSHAFCWNCTEEIHRPVDCETVEKWMKLNNYEAENNTWILAYTKPCPKCKRNIEKNKGCNHMRCGSPCYHRFCWLCLGPLDRTHRCNPYAKEKVGDKRVIGAREHLKRYGHYYERWAANHKSGEKALSDLNSTRKELTRSLKDAKKADDNELQFVIVEALEQIVECRRVLKWSYAYGYYLCLTEKEAKVAFFEFLQGQAEVNLERLHHCAEKEIETSSDDFKKDLVNLTNITRNYFEELVRALENDLSEVADTRKKSKRGHPSYKKYKKMKIITSKTSVF